MNYLLLIIIPTLLYLLEDLIPTKRNYFRKLAIAFIIIMASLRYNFGVDYSTYYEVFSKIQTGIFNGKFELGYLMLNKIISQLGLHFNFLLFIIALFNYILLYFTIEDNIKKYKWLSILIFLTYFDIFFYSLSAIRQSIVMSIFLYSSKYIITKKPIKFFVWLFIGSFFHWTSILLIPVYFIYQKLYLFTKKKALFFVISSVGIYLLFVNNLLKLSNFVGGKVEYYLFIHQADIPSNYFSAGIMLLLTIILIFISERMKTNKIFIEGSMKKLDSDIITFPFIALLIYFVLQIAQRIKYFSALPRIQMYFYPFMILAIPQSISLMKKKEKYFVIYSLIIFLSFIFLYKYSEINQYAEQYYQSFRLIFNK